MILAAVILFFAAAKEFEAYKEKKSASSDYKHQIPESGTYKFAVGFAEHQYQSFGDTVSVEIIDNNIKVIYMGDGSLTAEKGTVFAQGTLMKHKSGQWIITNKKSDTELNEVGGCVDGPSVIDFEKRIFWLC